MRKISFLAALLSSGAYAQVANRTIADPGTIAGAKSAGRAGATVASPGQGSDSLHMNPSAAAFQESYAVSAAYKGQGESLMASIVDSKSGPIGGGLYYIRRDFKDPANLNSAGVGSAQRVEDRAGAAAFGRLSEDFSVGTTVKWGKYTAKDTAIESFKKWNFNVGAQYQLNRQFSFGVVGQNLLKDNKGLDPSMVVGGVEARLVPGLSLSAQIFRVSKAPSDATYTFPNADKNIGWSAGAEYFFNDSVGLRAGYKDNAVWNETVIGAGASYQGKSFSVDYAFELASDKDSDESEQYHTVGVTALF